ncbi:phage tail tape measure protein [Candidatus Kapaibacterium sp.]
MDLSLKFSANLNVQNLISDLKTALDKLRTDLKNFGTGVEILDEDSIKSQFQKVGQQFEFLSKSADKTLKTLPSSFGTAGQKAGDEFGDGYRRNSSGRLVDANGKFVKENSKIFGDAGKKAGEEFSTGINQSTSMLSRSIADRMAQFALASAGLNTLAGSVSQLSQPFIALDTATASMKTLGDEAAEMAPRLREAAIAMSKDLPFGAAEIQAAMTDALASGVQGGEEGLKGFAETASKLAIGGGAELGSVVKGLGATLNAFGETSEETGRYADYMFNIVNAGVTTIDELNSNLSGVTPTAAAMGLSFDKVGGSLALMTQKGVPTAQSVTKLNSLLVELAKPSAGVSSALEAAGISMEDFHKMIADDDLVGALSTLQKGFEKTGKTATQSFSSSEAGAAFNILMGDVNMLQESLDFVSNTTGSTENAYQQMSETIEVQTKQMQASLDSFFITTIGSLGSMGPAFVTFSQSLSTISPQLTALGGLAAIVPEGTVEKVKTLATGVGKNLTEGLKTATSSAKGFTATLAANPIMATVIAVAALVAITKTLSDAMHETAKERLEDAKAENDIMKAKIEANRQERTLVQSKLDMVTAFEKQGEAAMENAELMVQLAKSYPGVISKSKSYKENLDALKKASETASGSMNKLKDEMHELAKQSLELDFSVKKIEVDVAKGEIEDELQSALGNIGDDIQDWIFGTSDARMDGEELIKPYTDAIYKAKDDSELQKAGIEFRMALMGGKDFENLTPQEKTAIDAKVKNFIKAQGDVINVRKKDIARDLQTLTEVKGMSNEDAIESLSKMYKLSKEEIQKMVTVQKESKAETKEQVMGVKELGDAWATATKATAEAVKSQESAINQITYELRTNKNLTKEQRQELEKQRKEYINIGKNEVRRLKDQQRIGEETQILLELKERESKGELESLKKIFEQKKKGIANSLEEYQITSDVARLNAGREKGLIDELALQERKGKSLEDEKEALKEIFKVKLDSEGKVIDVDIKLGKNQSKADVINELNNMLTDINNNIAKNDVTAIEIKSKIVILKKDIEEQLKDIEVEQLKLDIELGIKTQKDMLDTIENDYNIIKAAIEEKEKEVAKLRDAVQAEAGKGDGRNDKIELEMLESIKKLNALKSKEIDTARSLEQEKKKNREQELKDLQEFNKKELDELEKQSALFKTIAGAALNAVNAGMTAQLENDKNHRIKLLEDRKEAEVITEKQYNGEKEKIELEYQSKVKAIQDAARGAELEAERQQTVALLEEQKKRLEAEMALLDKDKDKEKYNAMAEQLSELEATLREKGDLLTAYSEELQSNLGDIFANLLGGDDEALKTSAKKMFATIGGILKKSAAAAATKLILDQLFTQQPGGFLAVAMTPIIAAVVNAAISKIVDPIISQITSFSTGGRVDEPTLAVVGDASQSRTGSNTEWIFRDDQLSMVIGIAISKYINDIEKKLKPLISELEYQKHIPQLSTSSVDELGRLIDDSNMHLLNMYYSLQNLNMSMESLPNNLKDKLTPTKIINIATAASEIEEIKSMAKKGVISSNDYLERVAEKKIRINSYAEGSNFLYRPELAYIGDAGRNNPEIVLNNPQLESMIRRIGSNSNEQLSGELSAIKTLLQQLIQKPTDVYLDRAKVTDEVQREMNIRKFTS